MRGATYRSPCPANMVRIIRDERESSLDRFVSYAEANRLLIAGKIRKVRLGLEYPDSYREISNDSRQRQTS